MTTATTETTGRSTGWPRALGVVVGAWVLSLLAQVLTAGHGNHTWSDVLAVGAFGAIGVLIVVAVVPRALRTSPGTAATTAVILGGLAVPVLVFFFSAAPFVVGYGSWFLARTPLAREASGARARVGAVLGLVVMVLNAAYVVYGVIAHFDPALPTR